MLFDKYYENITASLSDTNIWISILPSAIRLPVVVVSLTQLQDFCTTEMIGFEDLRGLFQPA